MLVCLQGVSVVEQEQLDNTMIEMDGTENKCESKDGRIERGMIDGLDVNQCDVKRDVDRRPSAVPNRLRQDF